VCVCSSIPHTEKSQAFSTHIRTGVLIKEYQELMLIEIEEISVDRNHALSQAGYGGKMANGAFTALSVAFMAGCTLYSGCR
jgi:hypothetical protein